MADAIGAATPANRGAGSASVKLLYWLTRAADVLLGGSPVSCPGRNSVPAGGTQKQERAERSSAPLLCGKNREAGASADANKRGAEIGGGQLAPRNEPGREPGGAGVRESALAVGATRGAGKDRESFAHHTPALKCCRVGGGKFDAHSGGLRNRAANPRHTESADRAKRARRNRSEGEWTGTPTPAIECWCVGGGHRRAQASEGDQSGARNPRGANRP